LTGFMLFRLGSKTGMWTLYFHKRRVILDGLGGLYISQEDNYSARKNISTLRNFLSTVHKISKFKEEFHT
jgi:hypothetical protein